MKLIINIAWFRPVPEIKELLFPTFEGLLTMSVAAEDIEAGTRTKTKFQTEPTLPIYLKVIVIKHEYIYTFYMYSCT